MGHFNDRRAIFTTDNALKRRSSLGLNYVSIHCHVVISIDSIFRQVKKLSPDTSRFTDRRFQNRVRINGELARFYCMFKVQKETQKKECFVPSYPEVLVEHSIKCVELELKLKKWLIFCLHNTAFSQFSPTTSIFLRVRMLFQINSLTFDLMNGKRTVFLQKCVCHMKHHERVVLFFNTILIELEHAYLTKIQRKKQTKKKTNPTNELNRAKWN